MLETLNHLYPKARRLLIATRDMDGAPIVLVYLATGQAARLDRSAFDRLMAMGISPNMFFNGNGYGNTYVRTQMSMASGWGKTAMVSRLLLPPAIRGVVVRHRDGNPLNLRLNNLVLDEGITGAKVWEMEVLETAAAA